MANLWGTFSTGTVNVVGGSGGSSSSTTPATTTSAMSSTPTLSGTGDRINIGVGPRLGAGATDTSGFSFVKRKQLTKADYLSNQVNFYNEFLGLPSLGASTGIDVDAPEVGEDVSTEQKDDSTDENEAVLNVLKDPTFTKSGDPTTGASSIKYGANAYKSYDSKFPNYSDYLKSAGKMDRVGLVSGIYEPFTKGNYEDINLGVIGAEVQEGVQAVKDAPKTISGEFQELREKGLAGVKEKVAKGVPRAMAGIFGTVGGPMMGMVGSLMTGETVQNAFGATSFRPSGPLGVAADLVHAKQYEDMTRIRAAESAARMESSIPGLAGTTDTGFAMQFGNGMGITRRPGARGYTGNLQGMSVNQIKDLEALTKGYRPETYRFDMGREDVFGGRASVSVEEDGGIFTDNNNRLKGFYTADGMYYTPGVGYSKYGNKADLDRLARTNGLSYDKAKDLLEDARAGKGKFGDLVQQEKTRIANERAEQRRQQEAAAKAAREAAARASRGTGGGRADDAQDNVQTSQAGQALAAEGGYSAGDSQYGALAQGGVVGMAAGGAMAAGSSGFIGAPPSQVPEEKTVADDQLTEYPEGTFIINAAAVEEAGESDIIKMLNDAEKEAVRRGIAIDKSGNSAKLIDVAVSQGEVKVAPYLAKIIGYDRLRKINNRGKPEVAERQQEAAGGGMLALNEGGTVTGPVSRPFRPDMSQLGDIEYRADLEEYIQNDDLARLGYNLFESGDLEIESVVLPSEEDRKITVGVAGMYIPSEDEGYEANRKNPSRNQKLFQRWVEQQQGPNSSDLDKPAAIGFVGRNVNYDKHLAALTMLHELRHAAISYLEKKYDIPRPPLSFEESMMDAQDYINRVDANKVKSSIPEESKTGTLTRRKKGAYEDTDIRRQLENFQTLAKEELIRERGVPERRPSIPQEGFFEKGFKSLFN